MTTQRIQFTEWLPDQPAIGQGLQDAKNVVPVLAGYAPFPSSSNFSNAASENLNSVFVGKIGDTIQLFGGGNTKLFKFDSTNLNMTDVSKTGGYGGNTRWSFTQFGDVVICANNNAKLQTWTVGVSTAFADLAAAAPVAKYVTVVRDFVVAANLTAGADPNKVQWSNINDETNWTSGAASQSDYQIIADGGNITGLSGGEFGLILLERAIYRMSYIGSPLFFQFDAISRNLGCIEGGSVTQYAGITYFLSDDGFYSCDGKQITPIGAEKVDKYFYNNFDIKKSDTMSATVDPVRKLVLWNYPTVAGGRAIIIYNWQLQKWSRLETDVNYVGSVSTVGTSLEGIGTLYTNIETVPASFDDRIWAGGKFVLGGVTGGKIITFTGSNLTANIVLSDIENGYNSIATLARPIIDNGAGSVSVASRRTLSDNIVFSTPVSAGEGGRCSLRNAGRWHRFSITPTGNWTTAIAIDVDITPQGTR